MKIGFKGQTVLITGATRGMGKSMANDFAKLGAELILTGTKEKQIIQLNKSVIKNKIKYYCVDFTSNKSVGSFIKKLNRYDKIDVCINNAGINRINYLGVTQLQDWDDIIDVNLKAPFRIMREVSKIMKRNNYGRIVNISSIFGVISKEKRSIYSTSKFGINGLTMAVANELAQYNILVNAVSPGFVMTDLTKSILSEEEMKKLAAQIPIRRFALPEEISRVVLFIASSLNTYINGQNLVVDGGFVNV